MHGGMTVVVKPVVADHSITASGLVIGSGAGESCTAVDRVISPHIVVLLVPSMMLAIVTLPMTCK